MSKLTEGQTTSAPVARPSTGVLSRPRFSLRGRGALTLILIMAFLWSLLQIDWRDGIIHSRGWSVLLQVIQGFVRPDLSPDVLSSALRASWLTLTYAVTGMTLALLLAVPLGLFSSGVLIRHGGLRRTMMVGGRGALAFMRAIHELVWALLFVAAIGLSPFAAIFALAIPYAGILGRIYADLLNDVPESPLQALRGSGAGEFKVFLYGRLPAALADMVSYSFYRFECALRSAAIMSFVGIGGLGYQIQISLDDLLFSRVATFLIALMLLVVVVDIWSSEVRRRMVS